MVTASGAVSTMEPSAGSVASSSAWAEAAAAGISDGEQREGDRQGPAARRSEEVRAGRAGDEQSSGRLEAELGRAPDRPYDGTSVRRARFLPARHSPTPGKIQPMAKSDKRPIIKLKSTAGTGYTYVTRKNKTNTRERIELMKYDPRIRKHVIFKEER